MAESDVVIDVEEVERKRQERLRKEIEALAKSQEYDETPRKSDTIAICYNPSCPDYRRERTKDEPCSCKRTRVKGAGVSPRNF